MIFIYYHSHSDDYGFVCLVMVVVAAVAIYGSYYGRKAVVKRKLRKTGGKKVADCQDGEVVKVKGEIKYVGKPLKAPLSERDCVYYYVLVEEYRSNGKGASWHTIIEEEAGADVVIRDFNAYAFIETKMVKSYLVEDRQYQSGYGEDATGRFEKYLEEHNKKSVGWFGVNKKIRYKEGILEEGETIAVTGKATWKRKSEMAFDCPAERILVISSTDTAEPVYLTDVPQIIAEN